MTRLLCLALLLGFSTPALAEARWVSVAGDAARWPDAGSPVSVRLVKGDEVEVLVDRGALVRVRRGTDFGWVASSTLTVEAPEPALDPELLRSLGLRDVPSKMPSLPTP